MYYNILFNLAILASVSCFRVDFLSNLNGFCGVLGVAGVRGPETFLGGFGLGLGELELVLVFVGFVVGVFVGVAGLYEVEVDVGTVW